MAMTGTLLNNEHIERFGIYLSTVAAAYHFGFQGCEHQFDSIPEEEQKSLAKYLSEDNPKNSRLEDKLKE